MNQRRGTLIFVALAIFNVALMLGPSFAGVHVVRWAVSFFLAWVAFAKTRRAFGWHIAAGMCLGTVGDLALAPRDPKLFLLGVGAFLVGHLFYIAALAKRLRGAPWKHALAGSSLALAGIAAWFAGRKLMSIDAGMAVALLIYTAVLMTMALATYYRTPTNRRLIVGAILFFVSDGHIAVNDILLSAPQLPILMSGMVLYMVAQYLIVFGAWAECSG